MSMTIDSSIFKNQNGNYFKTEINKTETQMNYAVTVVCTFGSTLENSRRRCLNDRRLQRDTYL